MFTTIITFTFPLFAAAIALYAGMRSMRKTKNARKSFFKNLKVMGIMTVLFSLFSITASAQTAEEAAVAAISTGNNFGLGLIAAGLSMGLAGIGAGIALASGAPAAIGAVSEDPKAFGKALIFCVLGETIALYGFIIAFVIISKL